MVPERQAQALTLSQLRHSNPDIVASLAASPFGVDFETNGNDISRAGFKARVVSMANDDVALAVDLNQGTDEDRTAFWSWVSQQQMVAHNTMFDFAVIYKFSGVLATPYADTYGMFADLACEFKRPWGLGAAISDCLGMNKLDKELKEYMKNNKLTWVDIDQFEWDALAPYAGIDAIGHWELFKYLKEIVDSYNDLWGEWFWDRHREDYLNEVMLQIEAKVEGVTVGEEQLHEVYQEKLIEQESNRQAFFEIPVIKAALVEYKRDWLAAETAAIQAKEPKKTIKSGATSKNWEKWKIKLDTVEDTFDFSITSGKQMKELIFRYAGIDPVTYTDKGQPSLEEKALKQMGPIGGALLKHTKVSTEIRFLLAIIENNQGGTVHPNIKLPATVTGRVGGGIVE